MKYEVIGWTYCGTGTYPPHEHITAAVDAAVIAEIRKYGYCFGGDAHEDYCPVLNDGTYVSYSWRGWGRIMAIARGVNDDAYAYSLYYMDNLINPSARKYPDSCCVDDDRIVPKETLTDTFVMHLSADMFRAVRSGEKTVEVRLFDDKRKLVDIGDYIEFVNMDDELARVKRRVVDLHPSESFKDLFSHEVYKGNRKWETGLRFTPESLGAPANSDLSFLVERMYKYYTKEQEKKYGVIAFVLEEPTCAFRTYLRIQTDSEECQKIYSERMNDPDLPQEEFDELCECALDAFAQEDVVFEISENFVRRGSDFLYGMNEGNCGDINASVRKTLEGLLGKEEELASLGRRFCAVLTLEIFTVSVKGYDAPAPSMKLDDDIAEFLKKANVRVNIDGCEV